MNGRYLLDTNIVIALFNRVNSAVERVKGVEEIFISSTVLGELYYGIDRFAAGLTVLSCDRDTAREYARIKNRLRAKGRMIPDNDIWIAAVAQQHGLTLLSRDDHFQEVDGLHLLSW